MVKRCTHIVLSFLYPIFVKVNFYHKFINYEENFITFGCIGIIPGSL